MTFTDALSAIFNDTARVTRTVWNNRSIFLEMEDNGDRRVLINWDSRTNSIDGQLHPWTLTEQDYFANDWEVVDVD